MMHEIDAVSDDSLDFLDISRQKDFSNPRIGAFYRPIKKLVSIRLDADVLAYYRAISGGAGYQTFINSVLRAYAVSHSELDKTEKRAPTK